MKKLFENFRRFVDEKEINERVEHVGYSGRCIKDGVEGYLDQDGNCIVQKEKTENLKETENKEQTKEELLQRLQELLEDWPACEKEEKYPMACKYHKDLEKVVVEFGGEGCPSGAHKEEVEEGWSGAPAARSAAKRNIIDEA